MIKKILMMSVFLLTINLVMAAETVGVNIQSNDNNSPRGVLITKPVIDLFDNIIGNCTAGQQVFGVNADGSKVCVTDATGGGGGGNPFNQSLNTTDNVVFAGVRATNLVSGGLVYADINSKLQTAATKMFFDINTGYLGLGTSTPNGTLHLKSNLISTTPFVIEGIAAQTEQLLRFRNGSGTDFLSVSSDGKRLEWLNSGNSIFIGTDAGLVDDLTNNWNFFLGYEAGKANTAGDNNLFLGYQAGLRNTIGFSNVVVGSVALDDNIGGEGNTAIGYNSLGSVTSNHNTGIGNGAGSGITNGLGNVVIGTASGGKIGAGDENIMIGAYIGGSTNVGINDCTAIGYAALWDADTCEDSVVIGHWTGANSGDSISNELYIDNGATLTPLIYGHFDNNEIIIHGDLNVTGDQTIDKTLFVYGNDSNDVSIWAAKNVSATGYITRTSIYDKQQSPFNFIKDADYYKFGTTILHNRFYGYKEYEITDRSRPEVIVEYEEECEVINKTTIECEDKPYNKIVYPYTKTEEGVDIGEEIDVLRQAVYELNERVIYLENEVEKLKK